MGKQVLDRITLDGQLHVVAKFRRAVSATDQEVMELLGLPGVRNREHECFRVSGSEEPHHSVTTDRKRALRGCEVTLVIPIEQWGWALRLCRHSGYGRLRPRGGPKHVHKWSALKDPNQPAYAHAA